MTLAQVEYAEQRMQQQWHDLAMAEQAGQPLAILEQMYDTYILMAEEYNACLQAYQQRWQKRRNANFTKKTLPRQDKQSGTKLAS